VSPVVSFVKTKEFYICGWENWMGDGNVKSETQKKNN
jgi:hypothetical protein